MKPLLARIVLTKLMGWDDPEEITRKLDLLSSMSQIKYDEYLQFNPGVRFFESLIQWVEQFEIEDRNEIYDFILDNLIFISNDEMLHLVECAFPDILNKKIIRKVAKKIGCEPYSLAKILSNPAYKEEVRKSLFIGLSDGSRIANFRRANSILNNEQVYPTYEISTPKCQDFIKDLHSEYPNSKFESVFLIDDFTASGISYFRDENGVTKGKIYKFLNALFNEEAYHKLIDIDKFSLHILFYISTQKALDHIRDSLSNWKKAKDYDFNCSVESMLVLEDEISDGIMKSNEVELLEKYYDSRIEDSNYEKGGLGAGWLGFNQCALPLVLNHNSPNNSLPIIWTPKDGDKDFRGLFPRISRHKDEYEAS